MSKAFTKEDDGDVAAEEPLPPRSSSPQPVTPQGLARLRTEHAALAARASSLAPAETRRLRIVGRILDTVYAREPSLEDGGAGFGCKVEFEDDEGHVTTYELVGADEADLAAGRLSIASPLARALVGKAAGDVVTLRRPKGDVEVRVRAVRLA
jgi:transcription elongation factor GreB